MWTPVKDITSKSTVNMSFGQINFNSPSQVCCTAINSLTMICNYIPESSKQGGRSRYSLLSKAYHEVPCFSIICNRNDRFLIIHLNINLSLSGIITHVGKCIMFPFKVTRTSFQSICTTCHNNLLSSLI